MKMNEMARRESIAFPLLRHGSQFDQEAVPRRSAINSSLVPVLKRSRVIFAIRPMPAKSRLRYLGQSCHGPQRCPVRKQLLQVMFPRVKTDSAEWPFHDLYYPTSTRCFLRCSHRESVTSFVPRPLTVLALPAAMGFLVERTDATAPILSTMASTTTAAQSRSICHG